MHHGCEYQSNTTSLQILVCHYVCEKQDRKKDNENREREREREGGRERERELYIQSVHIYHLTYILAYT